MVELTEGTNERRWLYSGASTFASLFKPLFPTTPLTSNYTYRDGSRNAKFPKHTDVKSNEERPLSQRAINRKKHHRAFQMRDGESCGYSLAADEDFEDDITPNNFSTMNNTKRIITHHHRRLSTSTLHGATPDLTSSVELMLTPEKLHPTGSSALDEPVLNETDGVVVLSGRTTASDKTTADGSIIYKPPQKQRVCGSSNVISVLLDKPFLSWMIIFIPFGFASWFLGWNHTTIFCLNFLAIMPQAWLIGKATEDLAEHLGKSRKKVTLEYQRMRFFV